MSRVEQVALGVQVAPGDGRVGRAATSVGDRLAAFVDRAAPLLALLLMPMRRQVEQHALGAWSRALDDVLALDQRRQDEAVVVEAEVGRPAHRPRPRAHPAPERLLGVALEPPLWLPNARRCEAAPAPFVSLVFWSFLKNRLSMSMWPR